MNNNPCIHPTNFTASGIPRKYFNGMAMNNNVSSEIPSAMDILLNVLS
jgi:hypothetical protein